MDKATAKAPANIAFIKYWGKINEDLRLPANSSVSMNLSNASTTTSVEFDTKYTQDNLVINNKVADTGEIKRVSEHLDRIRKKARIGTFARVISKNNFPKGAGIASSASGFAALTLAASKAAGLNLSKRELSILARLGSGSACRSIPDGFVEWKKASSSEGSFAYSLFPANYWDIRDLIAIVGETSKKVGSPEGHALAQSSPFYRRRILGMEKKVKLLKSVLKREKFTEFGELLEEEAINMHLVMMSSIPPLFYWLPETLEIILNIRGWRENGLECYFTIDAGPNVHVICKGKDANKIKSRLIALKGVKRVLVNRPARGARLI